MKKIDIAVVDYGMGNLRSVSKALEHVAPELTVAVTSDPKVVEQAERIVFPGQGAMPDCVRELTEKGLKDIVVAATKEKPFLGICIGLQMLFTHSEEGDVAGLNVFEGQVKRFQKAKMIGSNGEKLKVPHMGWNHVHQATQHKDHPLWQNIDDETRFYYVHSYYVEPVAQALTAGTTDYPETFTGAIAKDNVFAVQFHPEKSAQAGLQLLRNFTQWQPNSFIS